MNGFEKHNVTHVSPSSLNLWAAEPALWVMERLLKKRAPVGAAAHRGNAVETGVARVLEGATIDDGQAAALKEFNERTALSSDPKREKESDSLNDFVVVGVECLKDYGKPTGQQRKISWEHPDVAVPFIGFVDFDYSDHGILVDLKTTHRCPSSISTAHARQVALYAAASDNMSARVAYVTTKKHAVYELENKADHLNALVQIAIRMEKFLRISDDPNELASLLVPNYDSFYWSSPASRQAGFETFNF